MVDIKLRLSQQLTWVTTAAIECGLDTARVVFPTDTDLRVVFVRVFFWWGSVAERTLFWCVRSGSSEGR